MRSSPHTRILLVLAAGCAVALAVFLALSYLDPARILGVSRWIKPAKFAASIAIYAATMALLAGPIPGTRWICRVIFLSMLGELALIALQSARHTTSHFNTATTLDALIFRSMGVMIVANTVAVAFLYRDYVFRPPFLHPAMLSAIRGGLFLFLLASLQGFAMVALGAHTVGAPDGGPGLPFVNWSTAHGDLRVAHFFGLHAVQALPVLALIFPHRGWIRTLAAVWLGGFGVLLAMAFAGRPVWR
jgi:uncharacterized integral membrane protein